ncbi:MAG: hypothetical protein GY913_08645 [Proteobacteria bacterium]|nr:hypothetical protein [Pseudomonadota bacterium]MCP4916979.1 hypothetical protein [Pseudomonadota bacterium]
MDRRAIFIVAVLVVQALLPLRHYLGDDPYDERFAWRMFSPTRVVRCTVAYTVDDEPYPLEQRFHSGWITLLKRGRGDVHDAVDARICLTAGGQTVVKSAACKTVEDDIDVLAARQVLCR